MDELFEQAAREAPENAPPLADRMRPKTLDEFVGQADAVGPGTSIRHAAETDRLFSMILWGPPGCGKTTLARIIAKTTKSNFKQISAVLSGVKEIRAVIESAKAERSLRRRRTVLFVDEIHRFNKSQQDAFLGHVESGLITLIGATTENPSFEVIPALLSRCRVITLSPLSEADIRTIVERAIGNADQGLGKTGLQITDDGLDHIVRTAYGDARTALNSLELAASLMVQRIEKGEGRGKPSNPIGVEDVARALREKALLYDKSGEEHYNLISALHKSIRGSDPDGAVYWLGRMLSAGEDPRYIARRLIRMASEDIGNADPEALGVVMNAAEAYRYLGSPEGELALVQAAVYLAAAPKSNRLYTAWHEVQDEIQNSGPLPVPLHIRNAPTALMKGLGYGKDYKYAHDYEGAYTEQQYLPDRLAGRRFYIPADRGYERTITERLEKWRRQNGRGPASAEDDLPNSNGDDENRT